MTRLITDWIEDIGTGCDIYCIELAEKAGLTYDDLIQKACKRTSSQLVQAKSERIVAVVPITSGEGIITSFSDSVASAISRAGFHTFVTKATDVAGILEARSQGADILFMADDYKYIALNLSSGTVSDNNEATAKGFVTILKEMTSGIDDNKVLVMGAGTVGGLAANLLKQQGGEVYLYDKDEDKLQMLADGHFQIAEKADIKNFRCIIDATSEGEWITESMLDKDVKIAALGVPFSLDKSAENKYNKQVFYDCLITGTIVMLGDCL